MADHFPDAGQMEPARCEPPEQLRGVDGWHWIVSDGKEVAMFWQSVDCEWSYGNDDLHPEMVCQYGGVYLSPVATPAEVDALREKVKRAGQACFDAQQEALAARMDANEWCQKAQLWDDRVHRLRAEVASLRATLGHQPAAEGAEPIGCPIPGMCAAVTATATLRARVAELEAALDFYACVDHYPMHGAEAPDVVRNDCGARARAALAGNADG